MKLSDDLKAKVITALAARKQGTFTKEQGRDLVLDLAEQVGDHVLALLNNADIPRSGITGLALVSIGLDCCAEKDVDRTVINTLADAYYAREKKKAN